MLHKKQKHENKEKSMISWVVYYNNFNPTSHGQGFGEALILPCKQHITSITKRNKVLEETRTQEGELYKTEFSRQKIYADPKYRHLMSLPPEITTIVQLLNFFSWTFEKAAGTCFVAS